MEAGAATLGRPSGTDFHFCSGQAIVYRFKYGKTRECYVCMESDFTLSRSSAKTR
ncbi:hypothetical protein QCA50_019801 [Cerrena zonata]|uniref:Uncharacterized protein n=1 Tax=Cerrena zonata TaxID=2478898 RepID=A0AAW0FDH2_9APHY